MCLCLSDAATAFGNTKLSQKRQRVRLCEILRYLPPAVCFCSKYFFAFKKQNTRVVYFKIALLSPQCKACWRSANRRNEGVVWWVDTFLTHYRFTKYHEGETRFLQMSTLICCGWAALKLLADVLINYWLVFLISTLMVFLCRISEMEKDACPHGCAALPCIIYAAFSKVARKKKGFRKGKINKRQTSQFN